jgi:hypothetical protein
MNSSTYLVVTSPPLCVYPTRMRLPSTIWEWSRIEQSSSSCENKLKAKFPTKVSQTLTHIKFALPGQWPCNSLWAKAACKERRMIWIDCVVKGRYVAWNDGRKKKNEHHERCGGKWFLNPSCFSCVMFYAISAY